MKEATLQGHGEATLCDQEPIHIPGGIQPHGALLVLSEPSLNITHLYVQQRIRITPEVDYQMVPFLAHASASPAPLDLSRAILRSTSPVHRQYTKNLGATASMSLSLVVGGRLWGLIVCSHESGPRPLDYERRAACELVAEVTASTLTAKEDLQLAATQEQLAAYHQTILTAVRSEPHLINALRTVPTSLLALDGAQGAAIWKESQCRTFGNTPSTADLAALVAWLQQRGDDELWSTQALAASYPPAKTYTDVACGLLALSLSPSREAYLLWFRPEVSQRQEWGGEPQKVCDWSEEGPRLLPRDSFERFVKVFRDHGLPWASHHLQAVRRLRTALMALRLQASEKVYHLNGELTRSNEELDAFAHAASHDLKEPLRGIVNYTDLILEDLTAPEPCRKTNDTLIPRLQTILKLGRRMHGLLDSLLHIAQVGRTRLVCKHHDMQAIVHECLEMLRLRLNQKGASVQLLGPLPRIVCDRAQVNELLTNLLTNALKDNDKSACKIAIGCTDPAAEVPAFFVRDNGIGIRAKNLPLIFRPFKRLHRRDHGGGGHGIGLTIAQRIVARHGGQLEVKSVLGEGSTFSFTLGQRA